MFPLGHGLSTKNQEKRDSHGAEAVKFIGLGDITHGPKPHKFIGLGDIHSPTPYKFIGLDVGLSLSLFLSLSLSFSRGAKKVRSTSRPPSPLALGRNCAGACRQNSGRPAPGRALTSRDQALTRT